MMKLRYLPVLLLPLMSSCARADIKPTALFGDHMVLQRDKPIQVFGTADANEPIRVSIGFKTAATVADAAGKWRVTLPPMRSGPLTYDLTITGRDAAKAVVLHDVAIGEVWLCSGQSNMGFRLNAVQNANAEIAAANDPQLRLFTIPHTMTETPQSDVTGQWAATTPDTARGFSAAAYFFGRELREKLGVPVGLIHSSWGGTQAEAWTSRQAFAATPELAKMSERMRANFQKKQAADAQFNRLMAEWQIKADAAKAAGQPEPEGKPAKPNNSGTMPPAALYNGMIAPLAPVGIRGVIWYQGESNAGRAQEYRTLFPSMISDWRRTFAQGDFPFLYVQLANNSARQDPTQPPPERSAWAELREAQRLTLSLPNTGMAVILDTSSDGNLHPPEKQPVGHRLALWALKTVYNQDVPQSGPLFQSATLEGNQIRLKFAHTDDGLLLAQTPLVGNISPLVPQGHWAYAAVKKLAEVGIVPATYKSLGGGDLTRQQFAFIAAALPPYVEKWIAARKPNPNAAQDRFGPLESRQPDITNAQVKELSDALQTEFRGELERLGVRFTPTVDRLTMSEGRALIPRKVSSPIVLQPVQGFAIAGADKKFVWADAKIEGNSLVVSSAQVTQPVWVRYAWANNPVGNLYNGAGLPASSFEAQVASGAGK